MILLARQQPRLLLGQPPLDLHPGTWRAQPMATRVVPDPLHMPIWARLHMATQHGGATRQDRPDGPPYLVWERVAPLVRRIPQLQDRLKCELIRAHRRSITAHASRPYACRARCLPRSMRVSPTLALSRARYVARRLQRLVSWFLHLPSTILVKERQVDFVNDFRLQAKLLLFE
jgi:hypothetical protein